MTLTGIIVLLAYALVIFLVAHIVVILFNRAGINGTVRLIVYGIAALLVLVVLLNGLGAIHVGLPAVQ